MPGGTVKSSTRTADNAAAALRPGDVKLYLTNRGWTAQAYGTGGKGLQFTHPKFPRVDLLLPMRRELGDYADRMAELVETLAVAEKRPVKEVFNDLAGPSADVFRLRVDAPVSMLGSLPLDDGIRLLKGGRDLLQAAAQSTSRPRALHSSMPPREVTDFLRECRLGQTERGSFVATIFAPVPPELEARTLGFRDADFQLDREPFPRRVTARLMAALGLVSNGIQSGKFTEVLEGVEHGISANLCDALTDMKPPGDASRLDISVSWATTRSLVPPSVPQAVSFPEESFEIIKEVGRQLRTRAHPTRERFEGKVIQVHAIARPLFREVEGKLVLKTEVNGQTARVKADLDREGFRRACDALRDGKRVAIYGIIREDVRAREYELYDPTGLEVIQDR